MKTLRRVRKRQHRCYELAFFVMHEEPGAEKFKFVHGRIVVGAVWLGLFSIWKVAPQTMARIGGSPAKVRTALALALPL